ncbi:hypothetical protein Tco_0610725 [Tanacetum coccineum]
MKTSHVSDTKLMKDEEWNVEEIQNLSFDADLSVSSDTLIGHYDLRIMPPSAVTYCRRRKRGRHRESPPETRLLLETAATISNVVSQRYSRRRLNLFLFVLENTAVAAVQESAE